MICPQGSGCNLRTLRLAVDVSERGVVAFDPLASGSIPDSLARCSDLGRFDGPRKRPYLPKTYHRQ
jgi:hypothetical protein